MKSSSAHIDWLSFTVNGRMEPSQAYPGQPEPMRHTGRGAKGYAALYRGSNGASLATNGTEAGTTNVTLPGMALAGLRASMGVTDTDLARYVIGLAARVPRVDVALNLYDADLTVGDIVRAYTDGTMRTRCRNGLYVAKLKRPNKTLYLGSPKSDRLTRVYDKKAEQGTYGDEWLRIEVQTRNDRALTVVSALATQPVRPVVNRAIRDVFTIPGENDIARALCDDTGDIERVERKEPSTVKWLIGQVAPAMARYQLDNPEVSVLDIVASAYRMELKRKSHAD